MKTPINLPKHCKEWARKLQWRVRKLDEDRKYQTYKDDAEIDLELFEIQRDMWKFYEETYQLLGRRV